MRKQRRADSAVNSFSANDDIGLRNERLAVAIECDLRIAVADGHRCGSAPRVQGYARMVNEALEQDVVDVSAMQKQRGRPEPFLEIIESDAHQPAPALRAKTREPLAPTARADPITEPQPVKGANAVGLQRQTRPDGPKPRSLLIHRNVPPVP
jgi:hypothetical protein